MNVWKMNLKDNRDEVPQNLELSKFNFCKQHNIVGIGWAGYSDDYKENSPNNKNCAYEKAKNSISSFKEKDLVWVKNPETKEYYLCKIKSQVKRTEKEEFNKNDISMYCECDYQYIGTADKLPNEIKTEDLVSISTISKTNEQVSKATLAFCNMKEPEKSSKLTKVKFIFEKVLKNIIKYKWIYTSVLLAIIILLTAIITLFNNMHNKWEKEIAKSLADKTFVRDDYSSFTILKFNNKGKYNYGYAHLSNDEKEVTELKYYGNYEEFNINISLFGKKYFINEYNDKNKIVTDENSGIIAIGDFYPIDEEKKKMIKDYYIASEELEKEKKEIEEIKGYIPNKDEFYERVLQTFPEVKNWQLFGNSEKLYMDPNNNKNYFNVSEMPILTFNNSNNRITFMKIQNGLMISANGGNKLTAERYEQLIKLAFGNAPDELKICDLETFKKLTDTEDKAYPSKHSVEYKGITYEWNVGYKNGEQNSYTFTIKY